MRCAAALDLQSTPGSLTLTFLLYLCIQFLDRLAAGDESLYLTTQDAVPDAADGGRMPLLMPPLTSLRADFPLRPALAGALVPASINFWLGRR